MARGRSTTIVRRIISVAFLLTATGLAAAPASFGVVTIGSNLSGNPSTDVFQPPATVSQLTLPADRTAPGGLTSPFDGVIVRWRIRVGSPTASVALRVTRPGDSTARTGAGTSPTVIPEAGGAGNVTTTFENVRLPVRAGDGIGLDCCQPGDSLEVRAVPSPGTIAEWRPPLGDGADPRPNSSTLSGELMLNADIERDGDGDAHGDETQDACFTDSSTQGACPAPTISGTPQNGQTLTADPVGSPTNPSFQWLRCDAGGAACDAIPGATGTSYTLTPDDLGRTIRFRKTGQNASGSQVNDSAPTAVVELAPGPCGKVFLGTEGPDVLNGTPESDRLTGFGGDDSINGVQGDDCLDGGPGADTADGGEGADVVAGGDGLDRLTGGLDPDLLQGDTGNDVATGGEGADVLSGGDGVDRLNGDFGTDTLAGDAGNDNLAGGSGRDRLSGGPGKDVLSGGDAGDRLAGGAGNDNLTGGAGANRYSAGAGNDVVNGANGRRERVDCGPGRRDRARVDRSDRVRRCERVVRVIGRRGR